MGTDPKHNDLKNTVGRALGRIPSGLFVLTGGDGNRHFGMLVSWVQQAAFDPPAISLAIAKDRPILELILATKRFCLCVIGDGDTELMRRFARPRPSEEDAFEGLDVMPAPSGLPIPTQSLAWLDCEILNALDFNADHMLLVARVAAGAVLRAGDSFTHVRGNGFHY